MPRRKTPVKPKHRRRLLQPLFKSVGAIDIHFHGAFGIDLMTAGPTELDKLSERLWQNGIAGFCPTTVSTSPQALADAVTKLGDWIRSFATEHRPTRAVPIGIHLEGPFISSACCGAHPPGMIRRLDFDELENLWRVSGQTLRILTIAPEPLSASELQELGKWAKSRKIALSLGHSQASEAQAKQAFSSGFRGITHAWNALGFHHRSPGPLGAALGSRDTYVELIIDRIHVAESLLQWTRKLHPADRLCFISDCVPAAETSGEKSFPFGPLTIRYADGACRLENGALAGGGKLLTRSFCDWLTAEHQDPKELKEALRRSLPSLTEAPLWAIQLPISKFAKFQVEWRLGHSGQLEVSPIDSPRLRG